MSDGSSSSSDNDKSSTPSDRSNPFVAFRRLADEQMGSFFQSLFDLPSNLIDSASRGFKREPQTRGDSQMKSEPQTKTEPQSKNERLVYNQQKADEMVSDEEMLKAYGQHTDEWYEEDKYEEDKLSRFRKHFSTLSPKEKTSADEAMGRVYYEHLSKEVDEDRLNRAREHWVTLPSGDQKLLTPSMSNQKSEESKVGFVESDDSKGVKKQDLGGSFRPEPEDRAQGARESFRWSTDPCDPFDEGGCCRLPFKPELSMFPIGYVLFSPYSPTKLERSPGEPDWMEAFEDLMFAVKGLKMPNRVYEHLDEGDGPMSTVHEWMEEMIYHLRAQQDHHKIAKRELESSRMSSLLAPFRNLMNDSEETAENQEPETELDLYTHIFGQPEAGSQTVSSSTKTAMTMSNTASDIEPSKPPSILSTLTTTVRTTDPDGTVHTKVVLKKRFTDGTEESTESVHTTPGESGGSTTGFQQQQSPSGSVIGEEVRKRERGKGWFWRS